MVALVGPDNFRSNPRRQCLPRPGRSSSPVLEVKWIACRPRSQRNLNLRLADGSASARMKCVAGSRPELCTGLRFSATPLEGSRPKLPWMMFEGAVKEARTLCLACVCALTWGAAAVQADVVVALALTAHASPASTLQVGGAAYGTAPSARGWPFIPSEWARISRHAFSTGGSPSRSGPENQSGEGRHSPDELGPPATAEGLNAPGDSGIPDGGVLELPPPPSSSALALTGLAGLASLRGLRAARGLQFGGFPAWCYGLSPVGCDVDVSSDGRWSALPAFVMDAVAASFRDHQPRPPIAWVLPSRFVSQHLAPICVPRGPPSIP